MKGPDIEIQARHHRWGSSSVTVMTSLAFKIFDSSLEYIGPKNEFYRGTAKVKGTEAVAPDVGKLTQNSELHFSIEIPRKNTKIMVVNSGGKYCMLSFYIYTTYAEAQSYSASLLGNLNMNDCGKKIEPKILLFSTPYNENEAGIPITNANIIPKNKTQEAIHSTSSISSKKSAKERISELERSGQYSAAAIRNLWYDFRFTPEEVRDHVIGATIDSMKLFREEEVRGIFSYEECLKFIASIASTCQNDIFVHLAISKLEESLQQKFQTLFPSFKTAKGLPWSLSMSSKYSGAPCVNSYEALVSNEHGNTGAATNSDSPSYIQASFSDKVIVSSITLSGITSGGWSSSYINGAVLQYYDEKQGWKDVLTVSGVQDGKATVLNLPEPWVSQHWRLTKSGYTATATLIFE